MIPEFNNAFLADIAFSYKKRRKSLKHRTSKMSCVKSYNNTSENRNECEEIFELTVETPGASKRAVFQLHAWEDRWVWVDGRQSISKQGWLWEWTHEGRFIGDGGGRQLIEALEKSISLSPSFSDHPYQAQITGVWKPILASGPVALR